MTTDLLKNSTVMFEVAADAQSRALDGAAGRVQPATADAPNRRALEGSIPVALLPPGDYVARAVVSTDGRKVGQVTRPFRVGRTVTVTRPKPAVGPRLTTTRSATIPVTSATERFDRASVLTPQVVGFFMERLNVGARGESNPAPVVEHALAGRFDEALKSLSTGSASVPASFLSGLALYSRGELEPAAARFREALRLDSEFFPAAFYLGSCYAAGGRDQEAVGAWQLALVTESEAPFIFTLLGDALLRLREVDQALVILNEAATGVAGQSGRSGPDRIGARDERQARRGAYRKSNRTWTVTPKIPSAISSGCACSTRRVQTASRSSRRTRTGPSSRSGPRLMQPPKARSRRSSSSGRRRWLSNWPDSRYRHPPGAVPTFSTRPLSDPV